ncbi:MAG: putative lipid II flippase FtsW [Nitrospirae bacterium]|nr:putative lipid II flippase FtsW [Nitrospirota bacterium]
MDKARGDRSLILLTLLLMVTGLVMIYSASAVLAGRQYGDSLFFFKRQILWAAVGLIALGIVSHVPYEVWNRMALPLVLMTVILLGLVLIPGIGIELNGSRRWFRLGPLTLQPSEAARLCAVIYLARYLMKKRNRLDDFFRDFLPPMIVIGVLLALIMGESDLGTAAVLGLVAGLMLFIGGARWRHLWVMGLLAAPVLYAMIMKIGYRRQRWMAFLDPWRDPTDTGFQMIQSFLALGGGGPVGMGLGEGRQKLFFLPYPHTDFIFAVIGEELGLLGTLSVLVLFGMLAWRGLSISLKAPDPFGRHLAFGLTMMIIVQAMVNMAVVTGLLPTKGLTLPFLSYGGSSLVANLTAVGILWNISRTASVERSVLSRERIRSGWRTKASVGSGRREPARRTGGRGLRET